MKELCKKEHVTLLFGLCFLSVVQSNVFIVYPFQAENFKSSSPTFASRTLTNQSQISDTGIHVIYPVSEEISIMTPMPIEDYYGMELATTESADISTIDGEFNEITIKNSASSETTETYQETDGDMDTTTTVDDDAVTELTMEVNTALLNSFPLPKTSAQMKLLKKRMFASKPSPFSQTSNARTTAPSFRNLQYNYKQRMNSRTAAIPDEKIEARKTEDKIENHEPFAIKKARRRYTYGPPIQTNAL